MQENLIEYAKGQTIRPNIREIETISESEEDVE
jgi:hypothetical protein